MYQMTQTQLQIIARLSSDISQASQLLTEAEKLAQNFLCECAGIPLGTPVMFDPVNGTLDWQQSETKVSSQNPIPSIEPLPVAREAPEPLIQVAPAGG